MIPAGETGAKSWAGLNAARQEGRWDWQRRSMPIANGVEISHIAERSSHRNSSAPFTEDAFDFSRLPEAPTHTPVSSSSSTTPVSIGMSKMQDELRQPLLLS